MEALLWLIKRVYFFDSPGSRKDLRTCLRRCFKEDFKAVRISIENVSCEISKPATIPTIEKAVSVHLEIHVPNHVIAILTTYMETRLYTAGKLIHLQIFILASFTVLLIVYKKYILSVD